MNRTSIRNIAFSAILAALLLLAAFSLMGATNPIGPGVSGQKYQAMTFASTRYTSTQTASAAGVDVGTYGSVEIQTMATVTGSFTLTITPQFSNQPVPCSSASYWVDAFAEQVVPSLSRSIVITASADGTITTTVHMTSTTVDTTGSLERQSLSMVTTGALSNGVNTVELRELPTQGRCFRVKLTSNANVFTPTIYLRMVNRQ
jgi:hypothetical protein